MLKLNYALFVSFLTVSFLLSCSESTVSTKNSKSSLIIEEVEPGKITPISQSTHLAASMRIGAELDCVSSCTKTLSGNKSYNINSPGEVLCLKEATTFNGSLNLNAQAEMRICGLWNMGNVNLNGNGTVIKVAQSGEVKRTSTLNVNNGVTWELSGRLEIQGSLNLNGNMTSSGEIVLLGSNRNFAINGNATFHNTCSGAVRMNGNNNNLNNNSSLINEGFISLQKGHFRHQGSKALTMGPGAQMKTKYLTFNNRNVQGSTDQCSTIEYINNFTNNSGYSVNKGIIDIHKKGNRTCDIPAQANICVGPCVEIDYDSDDALAKEDSLGVINEQSIVEPVVVNGQEVQANEVIEFGEWVVVSYNTAGPGFKGALQFIENVKTTPSVAREFHFDGMEINTVMAKGDRLYVGGAADRDNNPNGSIYTYVDLTDVSSESLTNNIQFLDSYGVTAITSSSDHLFLSTGAMGGQVFKMDNSTVEVLYDQSDVRHLDQVQSNLFALVGQTDLDQDEVGSKFIRTDLNGLNAVEKNMNLLASPYHKMKFKFLDDDQIAFSLANSGVVIKDNFDNFATVYQSMPEQGISNGLDAYKKWLFLSYSDKGVEMLEYNKGASEWQSVNFWSPEVIQNETANSITFSNDHLFVSHGRRGLSILEIPYFEPRCNDV